MISEHVIAKRLWTLLTTEEVFHEDGASERHTVHRPSRVRPGEYLALGSHHVGAASKSIRTTAVADPEVLVAHAEQKFDDERRFTDEVGHRVMRQLLEDLSPAVVAPMAEMATARG